MGFAIVSDNGRLAVICVPDDYTDQFLAGCGWDREWVLSYHATIEEALKAMDGYQAQILN
jgi:hypothetical protein